MEKTRILHYDHTISGIDMRVKVAESVGKMHDMLAEICTERGYDYVDHAIEGYSFLGHENARNAITQIIDVLPNFNFMLMHVGRADYNKDFFELYKKFPKLKLGFLAPGIGDYTSVMKYDKHKGLRLFPGFLNNEATVAKMVVNWVDGTK